MWDTVIGLEVHAQLKTHSKLFSNASTKFGMPANTQTHFIDAAFPGTLPQLNRQAVLMAIQFGLAIDATINDLSYFERKHYFYPDLPKGYQISQNQRPIVSNGHLIIEMPDQTHKRVIIERAHLEEDAGKSLHDIRCGFTGIDLNRAGVPLLEIVTTPCLSSADEVICYLKNLQQLLRFLGICDGNMQEGSFRCDVNLSLKPRHETQLGTRTELKNLNSFRFIEKAIAYEQYRHQDLLERGQNIRQETRLYNPDQDITLPLREKEDKNDYRYMPDPDLLPIQITENDIATIQKSMPTLPSQIKQDLKQIPQLSNDDIQFTLSSPATYAFFNAVKQQSHAPVKTIINWLKGPYTAMLHEQGLDFETPPIKACDIACLLDRLTQQIITSNHAKCIFDKLITTQASVDDIIESEGYKITDNSAWIEERIAILVQSHPKQALDYRNGQEKLLGFFVGQNMKDAKGKADPIQVNTLLRKYLLGL